MDLNFKDLDNIDYALSIAIKSIEKYNSFDELDVSTIELKELQTRIQEEMDDLNYENPHLQ
jgi:hypothetical protein